jgi:alkylhydroperoxidase family enzyme
LQGEEHRELAGSLRNGDDARVLPVDERHRLLLEFVDTVTRHAHRVTDGQVDELRQVGWTDEQIAEAVYITAMFSFFVRLADAFDIHPPGLYEPDGVPAAVVDGPARP